MLRYRVEYFRFATTPFGAKNRNPDAYGFSDNLTNCIRNTAGRCATDLYGKAVIKDRKKADCVVRILRRTQAGLTIKTPEEDARG